MRPVLRWSGSSRVVLLSLVSWAVATGCGDGSANPDDPRRGSDAADVGKSDTKADGATDIKVDAPKDADAATDTAIADVATDQPVDMAADRPADIAVDVPADTGGPTTCNVATDCPGQDSECSKRTCVQGSCGTATLAPGLPVPLQVAGDCKLRQCDGQAVVVGVADNFDLPEDGNPCTLDICTNGAPSHSSAPVNQPCGGSNKCNGQGQCVGCNVAADCPGDDNACQSRTCTAGVCGFSRVATGTPIATQKVGDCKVVQCDGQGNTTAVNDNNDKPVDNNACTSDVCSAGTPSNPVTAAGTTCGNGRTCDGAGQCGQCTVAADCGSSNECRTYTCAAGGVCQVANKAVGSVLISQNAGDCKVAQCDGQGNTVQVNDNDDVRVDGNVCTRDVCTNGTPSNPPASTDTDCAGGKKCDGSGHCLGCTVPADCGVDDACRMYTCSASTCGSTSVGAGTVIASQTPNDCKQKQCDGSGNIIDVNLNTDTPADDSNVCTLEACNNGAPSTTNASSSTACTTNGGTHCDGAGMCVATTGPQTFMVVRIGDGTVIMAAAAAPVFVEERKLSDGTLVSGRTFSLPTVANPGGKKVLMLSSSAKSEGGLSLSADGHYLTLGGYAATADLITTNASISASSADRVVARINAAGTVETYGLSSSAFVGDNLRSVTSTDGSDIWAAGNGSSATKSGGVWYAKFGDNATTQLQVFGTGIPQMRMTQARVCNVLVGAGDIGIPNPGTTGHLYCTSDRQDFVGIFKVGSSPPPKAPLQMVDLLAGISGAPGPSPWAFAFVGTDTLYMADDNSPTAASKGGVQRWKLEGGNWTLKATFNTGMFGVRGLMAFSGGSNTVILATTADSNSSSDGIPNQILKIVDDGGPTPTVSPLVLRADPNTFFRGVALAPQ